MVTTPRLWHFPYSHYNEKVRWALDYKRIPHTRTAFQPGFHIGPALLRTGQRFLPILLTDSGAIADSSEIIAYLEKNWPERSLYPADETTRREALAWEDNLDTDYGVATRSLFLDAVMDCPEFIARQLVPFKPPFFELGLAFAAPGLRLASEVGRRLSRTDLKDIRRRIDKALEKIERRLVEAAFLAGDSFSVADLTAAALTSPIADFEEYPYKIRGKLPKPIRDLHARYADRPALKWAHGLYARYRGKSAEVR